MKFNKTGNKLAQKGNDAVVLKKQQKYISSIQIDIILKWPYYVLGCVISVNFNKSRNQL